MSKRERERDSRETRTAWWVSKMRFMQSGGSCQLMVGITKIVEKYSIHKDVGTNQGPAQDSIGQRSQDSWRSNCGHRGSGRGEAEGHGDGGVYWLLREEVYEAAGYRASLSSLNFEGKLALLNGVGDGGPQKMIEVLSVKKDKSVFV